MASQADLAIVLKARDEAHGVLGGAVDGLAKFGLAVGGIKAAWDIASGAIGGLIGDFTEAQQVAAQTAAVIQSTGGAAGIMASDVEALSSSLSKVTPFEDELIAKTQNMLLTFTNVGKEAFPQATEAALNMATALGEDPLNAAMRLGKALNDPVQGVTALRRVGVQLSEAQEEQIKNFVAVGDVASAQAIVLKELETEFGNSARAAGETFAGKLKIAETSLGNLKEIIGGPVVGALTFLLDKVTPLAEAFGEALPGAIESLQSTLAPVGQFLETEIGPRLESLAEIAKTAISGDFAGAFEGLKDLIESDVGPAIGEGLQSIGQGVLSWLGEVAPQIADKFLNEWLPAFLEFYPQVIAQGLERLGNLVEGIFGFIKEHGPGFLEMFISEWVPGFIGWVLGTALPMLIGKLAELAVGIAGWVKDNGPMILETFVELGVAIVSGILKGIGNLAGQLGNRLRELATGALNSAKEALGISSPSTEFEEEVGEPIVEGIIAGIESRASELQSTLTKLGDDAVRVMEDATRKIADIWGNLDLTRELENARERVDVEMGSLSRNLGSGRDARSGAREMRDLGIRRSREDADLQADLQKKLAEARSKDTKEGSTEAVAAIMLEHQERLAQMQKQRSREDEDRQRRNADRAEDARIEVQNQQMLYDKRRSMEMELGIHKDQLANQATQKQIAAIMETAERQRAAIVSQIRTVEAEWMRTIQHIADQAAHMWDQSMGTLGQLINRANSTGQSFGDVQPRGFGRFDQPFIPSYAGFEGIVPGPMGQAHLAYVHGGEHISQPGSGGPTYVFNGPVFGDRDFWAKVDQGIREGYVRSVPSGY